MEGDTTTLVDALVLHVRTNAPPGTRLVLFRDGREAHRVTSAELVYATNRPGAYRAEAWLPGVERLPMPWAVSNAITAIAGAPVAAAVSAAAVPSRDVVATVDAGQGWHVEHDPASSGNSTARNGSTSLDFRLDSTPKGSQFVALVHPLRLPPSAAALAFRGVAPQPMRVSVQLRVPGGTQGERWGRSVYLDSTPRDVVVPLAEMRPAGRVSSAAPRVAGIDSLLLVVDGVHTRRGTGGRFAVSNVRVLGSVR
jgi:hypothetical protein